ncbi:MAG: hypothetical protein EOM91_20075 [Sphingobacteriia bacterium]|nr:hypothetical protein [Sphingobacteriia bacterium]
MTDQPAPTTLDDLTPYADFARECARKKVATESQLAWWMRYRAENGLLASGAIIEKRVSPHATRPLLYAHRSRFIAWLSTSDEQGRAA